MRTSRSTRASRLPPRWLRMVWWQIAGLGSGEVSQRAGKRQGCLHGRLAGCTSQLQQQSAHHQQHSHASTTHCSTNTHPPIPHQPSSQRTEPAARAPSPQHPCYSLHLARCGLHLAPPRCLVEPLVGVHAPCAAEGNCVGAGVGGTPEDWRVGGGLVGGEGLGV